MNILVTGGAGFIGSHVSERLVSEGHDVTIIDDFNNYYDPSIKENNIKEIEANTGVAPRVIKGDIRDKRILESIFSQGNIDRIVHLAARAGVRPSIDQAELYVDVNIRGTLNLLEMAKQYGINNFVYASSSSVYGNKTSGPFKEDDDTGKPVSPYAATKKSCEVLCHAYSQLHALNVSCLRFFTVYGPRGRPDMAPYLFTDRISRGEIINMYGDGSSARDYTYINDIVTGVISAIKDPHRFEIFNLGNSNPITLKDFISIIEDEVGKRAIINQVEMPAGDVKYTCADVSKAKKMLGYNPQTNIKEGIKKFVEWYKIH